MEVRSALTQLQSLATSPLAHCLRSITLSDWSVVHTGILLWIQTAVEEGEALFCWDMGSPVKPQKTLT